MLAEIEVIAVVIDKFKGEHTVKRRNRAEC